ncbi:MAG: hypothetical protein HY696_11325 [Deltaproteobacteria bacterium]|nr:hypothetical protein [Deltaproteobacteria bacterium]
MQILRPFGSLVTLFLIVALAAPFVGAAANPTWVQSGRKAGTAPKTAPAKTPQPPTKKGTPAAKGKSTKTEAKSKSAAKTDTKKKSHAAKDKARPAASRGKRPLPALLEKPRNMPLQTAIPGAVVTLLADGEIAAAVRRLYLEPASVRGMMLIREMERIGEAQAGVKPAPGDEHHYYLNLGVAYHNLILFLKNHGTMNKRFVGKATQAYSKARRATRGAHQYEADLLTAALAATMGKTRDAERRVAKVKLDEVTKEFGGLTALISYYAATGDVAKTIATLQQAQPLDNSHQLKTWVQIGDDFFPLKNDPAFQDLLVEWAVAKGKRR